MGRGTFLRFLPVPTPTELGSWDVGPGHHPDSVLVCRLGLSQQIGAELFWEEDQSVEDFLEALALKLRAEDRYPGDEVFSKQAPLVALKDILGRALQDNRSGKGGSGLRGIVMYLPSGWVINRYSLFNLRDAKGTWKGLYHVKTVLDAPYKEREIAIAKHLEGIDLKQARYIVGVVQTLFTHKVLDPDEPPF